MIMEGEGDLGVLVALHIQNSTVDTVYGTIVSADSIVVAEQIIGNFPGTAEIVLIDSTELELSQHGLGITCRAQYGFNYYPPVITRIHTEMSIIEINSSVEITCEASDPNDDVLTYNWTASQGSISGSVDEIIYSSSDSSGLVEVTCTVSDGTGGVDHATLYFNVTSSTRGVVSDIDGNEYQTVVIGDQTWMAEDLKVTHYRNGVPIPTGFLTRNEWQNLESGGYAIYDDGYNDPSPYGYLYNWYAVSDSNQIAPEGWHVASDEEWKVLESYIGMSQAEVDSTGWRGEGLDNKLKDANPARWYSYYNEFATNEYGFSAIPGGQRNVSILYDNDFVDMRRKAIYWTATADPRFYGSSWRRVIHFSGIYRGDDNSKNGYSVRCIKD